MPEGMVVPEYVRQNTDSSEPRPEMKRKGRSGGRKPGSGGPGMKVIRAERNVKMAALFADGKTLEQISERVGLAPSTISKTIDDYVRKLEEQALEHVSRRIARSEAVYRYCQLEAHLGWIRSQNPKKVVSKKKIKEIRAAVRRKNIPRKRLAVSLDEAFEEDEPEIDMAPAGVTEEEGERKETAVGDVAFLRLIMDCQHKIDELRSNIPRHDGGEGQFGNEELKRLGPEERARKIQSVVEKLQLKLAQRLALGEAPEYVVIDAVKRPASAALPARPFARQPIPEAPAAREEAEDSWLL